MADGPRHYDIRPQPRTVADTALEGCFRVYLSQDAMEREKIKQGDWILLSTVADFNAAPEVAAGAHGGLGIAWRMQDGNVKKQCIKLHDSLRCLYGLELKDKIMISKYQGDLRRIQSVSILEITQDGKALDSVESREQLEFAAAHALFAADAIECGLTFEATPRISMRKGRKRKFLIDRILPRPAHTQEEPHMIPFFFDDQSTVKIGAFPAREEPVPENKSFILEADFSGLFGLDSQLEQLNATLRKIGQTLSQHRRRPLLSYPGPILIHGPSGTGKSTILSRLENAPWAKHFHIVPSMLSGSPEKAHTAFAKLITEARASDPSLITLDDIDWIASNNENHAQIATLIAEQIRALQGTRVHVVATTRTFFNVNDRISRCFHKVIELPIPSEAGRREIVNHLTEGAASTKISEMVAERTPAFIADDLKHLCEVAFDHAQNRNQIPAIPSAEPMLHSAGRTNGENVKENREADEKAEQEIELLAIDFDKALDQVHASVMNEVYIEVPKVYWSEIKGSAEVKRKLYDVLGFPIKHPELVAKWSLELTMGILLYGPPGCSKTLTAKAVATEYGCNFIAVKGPELISKYVGESEQKIRDIFRRARAAAPSVIFFDEIDSIAPRRDSGGHEGLNTVATLLNEMDGIQGSKGVFVLAATNRPYAIDPALLRPKRLGTMIYTGPPDFEARRQIIAMRVEKRYPSDNMDIEELAKQADGYSGADVVELCELAACEAAKEEMAAPGKQFQLRMEHFQTVFKEMRPLAKDMVESLKSWRVDGVVSL